MAALRAAVFPLSSKNRRGGHFLPPPPSSARVKEVIQFRRMKVKVNIEPIYKSTITTLLAAATMPSFYSQVLLCGLYPVTFVLYVNLLAHGMAINFLAVQQR